MIYDDRKLEFSHTDMTVCGQLPERYCLRRVAILGPEAREDATIDTG